jgi:hypothetical protein
MSNTPSRNDLYNQLLKASEKNRNLKSAYRMTCILYHSDKVHVHGLNKETCELILSQLEDACAELLKHFLKDALKNCKSPTSAEEQSVELRHLLMPKDFDQVYETVVNEVKEEIRNKQLLLADNDNDDELDVVAQSDARKARLKEEQKARRKAEQKIKRRAKKESNEDTEIKRTKRKSAKRIDGRDNVIYPEPEPANPGVVSNQLYLTWNRVLEETTEDNVALDQPLTQQNRKNPDRCKRKANGKQGGKKGKVARMEHDLPNELTEAMAKVLSDCLTNGPYPVQTTTKLNYPKDSRFMGKQKWMTEGGCTTGDCVKTIVMEKDGTVHAIFIDESLEPNFHTDIVFFKVCDQLKSHNQALRDVTEDRPFRVYVKPIAANGKASKHGFIFCGEAFPSHCHKTSKDIAYCTCKNSEPRRLLVQLQYLSKQF